MKDTLRKELVIPPPITVKIVEGTIQLAAPDGIVEKKLSHPRLKIFLEGDKLILEAQKATKKEKKLFHTFHAHLKNLFHGLQEKYVYKLKICSGHFPMNVSVSGRQLLIKNFYGESTPRRLALKPGVDVKVEGNQIIVTSPNKEIAGQVAADIEQLTRVKKHDIRIFQDGCYIIQKAGKEI